MTRGTQPYRRTTTRTAHAHTQGSTPNPTPNQGMHSGSKRRPGDGPRAGYDDKRYRDNCQTLRITGSHICAWCHLPIDTQLKAPHPLSWTADHIVPRSTLHPLDDRHWMLSNLTEMHRRCNSSRGAKPMPVDAPLTTTRPW